MPVNPLDAEYGTGGATEPLASGQTSLNPLDADFGPSRPAAGTPLSQYVESQAGRGWDETSRGIRAGYGFEPGESIRSFHAQRSRRREQDTALQEARQEEAPREEGFSHTLQRRLPFVRTAQGVLEDRGYNAARSRFLQYQATPEDYQTIARYEHLQGIAREREEKGGWAAFGDVAATLPALAAEVLTGGRIAQAALRPLGLAGPAAERVGAFSGRVINPQTAAQVAQQTARVAATTEATGTGVLGALGRGAAHTLATEAALPEMWLPGWTRNNVDAGRDTFDLRGLPPAALHGFVQTAIMGQVMGRTGGLEERIGIGGTGLLNRGARTALRGTLGVVEQQAADVVQHLGGLQTNYGLIDELLSGHGDRAAQHGAQQMLTFAVLANLHNNGRPQRQMTREEAVAHAMTFPEGPERQTALEVANRLTAANTAESTIPSLREGPEGGPNVTTFPTENVTAAETAAPETAPGAQPSPPARQRGLAAGQAQPSVSGRQRWQGMGMEFGTDEQGRSTFTGRNGRQYRITSREEGGPDHNRVNVFAHDAETGQQVGTINFKSDATGGIEPEYVVTHPEHQGNGISTAMHEFANERLGRVERSTNETPEGARPWESNQRHTIQLGAQTIHDTTAAVQAMQRNGTPTRVQSELVRHINAMRAVAPDVAAEIARTLRAEPHRARELLDHLNDPKFVKEVESGARESGERAGVEPASLRTALGQWVQEGAQVPQAANAPEGDNAATTPAETQGSAETPGTERTNVPTAQATPGGGGEAAGDLVSHLPHGEGESQWDFLNPEINPQTLQRLAEVHASGDAEHLSIMEDALGKAHHEDRVKAAMDALGPQNVTKPRVKNMDKGLNRQSSQRPMHVFNEYERMRDEQQTHEQEVARQSGATPEEIAAVSREFVQAGASESAEDTTATEPATPPTPEERAAAQVQFDAARAALDAHNATKPDLGAPKLPEPEPARGAGERPAGAEPGTRAGAIWDVTKDFLSDEKGHLLPGVVHDFVVDQYEKMKTRMAAMHDGFRRFAGAKMPNLTRLSRLSGEAAGQLDTAPDRARAAAPYFTDKMMGGEEHTEAQRKFIGATFNEWRLQHIKSDLYQQAATELARAQATGKPSPLLQDLLQRARDVKSFIGTPDYAATQADFQRDLNSPEFRQFLARWSGRGGFAEVMEENFRKAQGLADTDPIDSHTQIPGFPMNLLAVERAGAGPGGQARGNLANTRARKLSFSNEASGTSDAYETDIGKIIENSLVRGTTLAAKANFLRISQTEGVGTFGRPDQRLPDHTEFPNVKPPRGTQAATTGQTSFYFRNEAAPEVRQLLQVDKPWSRIPGSGLLTALNLAGLTEAGYHTLNNMTMMFKPGMSPVNLARNAWGVMRGSQELQARIIGLAKEGVGIRETHGGLFGGGKLDPTSYVGKFLAAMHQTMALTMEDAFTSLRSRGLVSDTITNKRDFINQLGNYSKKTQNSIVAFLRDTGLGPTATAGTNFTAQAMRAMALGTGLEASSPQAAFKMKTAMLARGLGILASVGIANYLRWGRLDGDDNTPLGALLIGRQNGKSQYLDIFGYTPWGRGMKATGAASLVEGTRAGAPLSSSIDQGVDRVFGTLLHPFLGAPVQFARMAATGKDTFGRQIAPQARPGESQAWQNLQTSLWNVNPAVATISGHNTAPLSHGRERETDWSSLLGPLGPKTRSTPPGAPSQFRQITVPARGYRPLRRQP